MNKIAKLRYMSNQYGNSVLTDNIFVEYVAALGMVGFLIADEVINQPEASPRVQVDVRREIFLVGNGNHHILEGRLNVIKGYDTVGILLGEVGILNIDRKIEL